jgi:hypothetical protein
MNKSETEKAVKSANGLKAAYPLDEIEQLFEQYEEAADALQEKIDRLEGMEN